MVIYTSIDTETKTVAVWTDETLDYYAEWQKVRFDLMKIQDIIEDVEEAIEEEEK